ncbi:MAG: ferredoxin [FCB group bacterium]|jgi:2-oxoglutarate ferredoxin oxidoreductase subunit delta
MAKEKQKIKIYIDETLCKGCDICKELCKEKVFITSEHINSLGYYVPVPVNITRCNACMICELICPELAVIIEKTDIK